MKMHCPQCDAEIPADQVNIPADTALCPHCSEMFRPSEILGPRSGEPEDWSGDGVSVTGEKPTEKEATVEYFDDGGVGMYLPSSGVKGRSAFFFIFALIWDAIVAAVGGGFVMGMIEGEVPWLMILFFVPFILVGVLMPIWACWLAWGTTSVGIDAQGLWLEQKLFGRKRLRTYPLEQIEGFRRNKAYEQNDQPVYACCAKVNGKKYNFAHKLTDEHQQWLVNEFNQALRRLQASA